MSACLADSLLSALRAELRTMPYEDFLQTQYWQEVRVAALERAGHRCQLCNADGRPLHVHHRTYERRGCELPGDLTVLCDQCHDWFHERRELAALSSRQTVQADLRAKYGKEHPCPDCGKFYEITEQGDGTASYDCACAIRYKLTPIERKADS
jgi:hypothetical protein